MKFESLANELFLGMLEYLNDVHGFRAFYGLNHRFDRPLVSPGRFHHLNFRSVHKEDFEAICHRPLPTLRLLVLDQIRSKQTIVYINEILSSLTHLHFLALSGLDHFYCKRAHAPCLLSQIQLLPNLTHCYLRSIFLGRLLRQALEATSRSLTSLSMSDEQCDVSMLIHLSASIRYLSSP